MTWKEGLIGVPLAVLGGVLVLLTVAGAVLTRTDWGHERLRSFAVERLNREVRGRVQIDAVVGGDLLRGLRVAGVRVDGPDGREFARVDTLDVRYRWWDFLAGDVVLSGLRLVNPDVSLRVDTAGRWNYEDILGPGAAENGGDGGDTRGSAGASAARGLTLRSVTIRGGTAVLRVPWRPDRPSRDRPPNGRATTSTIEPVTPRPPSAGRRVLERSEDGWERLVRIDDLRADLPTVRVGGRSEGLRVQIRELGCAVHLYDEPLEIENLRADVGLRGDSLVFDVWELALPGSHLFGRGHLVLAENVSYDISARATPIETRDLLWLEPDLPVGRADVDLRLIGEPDGLGIDADNFEWESDEARVSGRFGLRVPAVSSDLELADVELRIDRLSSSLLGSLTGWEPPESGTLMGDVSLDGRLRGALRGDMELRFQPESGPAARIRVAGTVLGDPGRTGARQLELSVDTLPLRLVRAFVPGLAIGGGLTGTVELDGHFSEGMSVRFDLEQQDPGLEPSRLDGSGRVVYTRDAPPRVDLSVRFDPLALSTLARYYPQIPIRGSVRGSVDARGSLHDIHVDGRVVGAGDSLRASADLRLSSDVPRYRGTIRGWRVRLVAPGSELRSSDVDFSVEFDGEGSTLPNLRGRARARISSSFVSGVRFDSSYAEIRIADQRVHLDTMTAVAEFGQLSAAGVMALADALGDTLRFDIRLDSIGALNPWLFPAAEAFAGGELVTNGVGSTEAGQPGQGLEGSAHIVGRLAGSLGDPSVVVSVEARHIRLENVSVDSLSIAELNAMQIRDSLRLRTDLALGGTGFGDLRFRSVRAAVETDGPGGRVQFDVESEGDAAASGRVWARLGDEARTLGVEELTMRFGKTSWRLREEAEMRLEESGAIRVDDFELVSPRGQVRLGGSIGVSGPVSFGVHVSGVDLADIAMMWPDTLGLAGRLSLEAELTGRTRNPVIRANLNISDGKLFGASFASFGGSLGYEDRDLTVDLGMERGGRRLFRLHGSFPLSLGLPSFAVEFPEEAIIMTFEGDSIPLSLVSVATDAIEDPAGWGTASVLIRGSPRDMSLVGRVGLAGGALTVVEAGVRYGELEGALLFRGDLIELRDVRFRGPNGGRGTLSGMIDIDDPLVPVFDLRLVGEELLAYDRLAARMTASGDITLSGPYNGPEIGGKVSVVSGAVFVEELGRQREIIDPFVQDFLLLDTSFGETPEVAPRGRNPFVDNMAVNLDIEVARNTWLRGRLGLSQVISGSDQANIEMAGNLKVRLQPDQEELRVDGTLRAVRGDYKFLNKRFEILEGTVEFVGTPAFNPNLDLVAQYRVPTQKDPVDIRLVIGGTLEQPTLRLESGSQPPINESDLLSYLLFGRPSYDITRTRAEDGSLPGDVLAGVPQAIFGYALESLIVGETGIEYLDVTRAPGAETGATYGGGLAPALAATQVEVGWYLAPSVFVSVAQQLAGAVDPRVRVEWRLNNNLTIRGVTEPRGGRESGLFTDTSGEAFERAIGLFLFYGWAY